MVKLVQLGGRRRRQWSPTRALGSGGALRTAPEYAPWECVPVLRKRLLLGRSQPKHPIFGRRNRAAPPGAVRGVRIVGVVEVDQQRPFEPRPRVEIPPARVGFAPSPASIRSRPTRMNDFPCPSTVCNSIGSSAPGSVVLSVASIARSGRSGKEMNLVNGARCLGRGASRRRGRHSGPAACARSWAALQWSCSPKCRDSSYRAVLAGVG